MVKLRKRKQIINHIRAAKKEMNKFRERYPNKILPLQQAGNKIHKAYTLLVEGIVNKDIKTSKGIEMQVFEIKDVDLIELYHVATYLHSFWYEGQGGKGIKLNIRKAIGLINKLMRKYKVI